MPAHGRHHAHGARHAECEGRPPLTFPACSTRMAAPRSLGLTCRRALVDAVASVTAAPTIEILEDTTERCEPTWRTCLEVRVYYRPRRQASSALANKNRSHTSPSGRQSKLT